MSLRKKRKQLIAAAMVALMVMGAAVPTAVSVAPTAFAQEIDIATVESQTASVDLETFWKNSEHTAVLSQHSNRSVFPNYFGNQLSAQSRKIYDALVKAYNNGNPSQALRTGQSIRVVMEEKSFSNSTGVSSFVNTASTYLQYFNDAVAAFDRDYPQVFWFRGGGATTFVAKDGADIHGSYSVTGGTYSVGLDVTLELASSWTLSGGRSLTNDLATVNTALNNLVKEANAGGSTRYAKLLALHDWLTENNIYNTNNAASTQATISHSPISALVRDERTGANSLNPVCEGYARAFKMVCDKLEIPCVLVSGRATSNGSSEDHMWNYVQMEDGKWYAVDVTWDDPAFPGNSSLNSGGEDHTYFLVGSNTAVSGSTTFSNNHIASGSGFVSGRQSTFAYPALSATAYQAGSHGNNNGGNADSNTVRLDTSSVSMLTSGTYSFLVRGNNNTGGIAVTVENPSVASVSLENANDSRGAKYRVTALAPGETEIRVTYQGQTASIKVKVTALKGSITLDTAQYTLAPGNMYTIGAFIKDANGNPLSAAQIQNLVASGQLVVRDSRTGSIVDLVQLSTGNFRVVGKKEGTTYIIYEIGGTHASVRVDVRKGAQPGGSAVRNTSYFI